MSQKKQKSIATNTVILYFRMLFSMGVSLYTSRVVLNFLGVEDYGIYAVAGGVVGLLSFLNTSMSGATSRFLTYEMREGNEVRLRETFSTSMIIHLGVAVITFLLAETIGLYLLNEKLSIPPDRMEAAFWTFQISVVTMVINFTQIPYNAVIIARENMSVYAYVEILNVSLKLLVVFLLPVINADRLVLYAVLMLLVTIIITMTYRFYCVHNYAESRFLKIWNMELMRPMLSFSGWDLYGNICGTIKAQGVTVLLNMYLGLIVNAASSLAATVIGSLSALSLNIVTVFRPQIIKRYASGDLEVMSGMVKKAIIYTSLLLLLMALPLVVEMNFILSVWLKNVPDYTVGFTRLAIISSFAGNINAIILAAIHATGKIKMATFVGGTLYLLNLLAMYIYLHYMDGSDVYFAFGLITVFFVLVMVSDIAILKKLIPQIRIGFVCINPIIRLGISFVIIYIVLTQLTCIMDEGWWRLVLSFLVSTVLLIIFSLGFIMGREESMQCISFIRKKFSV